MASAGSGSNLPTPPRVSMASAGSQDRAAVINERGFQKVFMLLEEIKQDVKSLTARVDRLTAEGGREVQPNQIRGQLPEGFCFPLLSPSQLESLEAKLTQEEVTRKQMVRHLGTIGGKGIRDSLRHILATIFSTLLARQYNYFGMKGKRSFIALRSLAKVINESVRRQHPDATEQHMKEVIATWLSGSRDRDNGKKQREEAKRARETETGLLQSL